MARLIVRLSEVENRMGGSHVPWFVSIGFAPPAPTSGHREWRAPVMGGGEDGGIRPIGEQDVGGASLHSSHFQTEHNCGDGFHRFVRGLPGSGRGECNVKNRDISMEWSGRVLLTWNLLYILIRRLLFNAYHCELRFHLSPYEVLYIPLRFWGFWARPSNRALAVAVWIRFRVVYTYEKKN
jgi:hypothetical protein